MLLILLLTGCDPTCHVTAYQDGDGDGYGTEQVTRAWLCEEGPGWSLQAGDCDDADAELNPAADEVCDGVDQDCDGLVDDHPEDGGTWYPDRDGDGHGSTATIALTCEAPTGFVDNYDDCNDASALAYPGGSEVCGDGVDNDCDGSDGACGADGEVELSETDWTEICAGYAGADVDGDADPSGDGLPDLAVTDENYEQVYVVSGPPDISDLSEAAAVIAIGSTDVHVTDTGLNATFPGDLDLDGTADLVVGFPQDDPVPRAMAFYGPLAGTLTAPDADWRAEGARLSGQGTAVAGAGDLDGDGAEDLLVTAPDATDGGQVLAFLSPPGDAAAATVTGTLLGAAVVSLGDTDGDGLADVAAGGSRADRPGSVYLFRGLLAGDASTADADAELRGEAAGDGFGQALARAGDLDDDGLDDLLVGMPGGSTREASGAFAFLGSTSGVVESTDAWATWTTAARDAGLGAALTSADLDLDGVLDVVLGAPGTDSHQFEATVFVFDAEPGAREVTEARVQVRSGGTTSEFGAALDRAGDVDQDGDDDVLIGEPGSGCAWILPGGAGG